MTDAGWIYVINLAGFVKMERKLCAPKMADLSINLESSLDTSAYHARNSFGTKYVKISHFKWQKHSKLNPIIQTAAKRARGVVAPN